MNTYKEDEVKVLDIEVTTLMSIIERLGAKKVFDGKRVFTTFDTKDNRYISEGKIIRLTEETTLKLSISYLNSEQEKETVKLFTSRKQETLDFLKQLDIHPITQVESHRISYEWENVDFDIDQFPEIPAFLEIDLGASLHSLNVILERLGLSNHRTVQMGTEQIFSEYSKDYFDLFKV